MSEYLTVKEAAAYLRIGKAAMYTLMESGRLEIIQVNSKCSRRISRRSLEALCQKGEVS